MSDCSTHALKAKDYNATVMANARLKEMEAFATELIAYIAVQSYFIVNDSAKAATIRDYHSFKERLEEMTK